MAIFYDKFPDLFFYLKIKLGWNSISIGGKSTLLEIVPRGTFKKKHQTYFFLYLNHKCYKLIQRFRVTGLFAGKYTTGYYGTFTDVI